ncbi:cation diffusion facilitator family transporter [Sphingomonas sp.]|uniref:cation diffusion facilitator family transporter n=1 Tax=Sphingomonas sp. TaxID=28214 RepID=UPI0025CCC275|nr:cation diffusion facilitator family transporter [Sphingomonas sp.]MBV9528130.1 cation transporter [Sphingomonas sp.]
MAGHAHDHDHSAKSFGRAFAIGVTLNFGFVVIEAVFGFIANSMTLIADAGHNLSDVLGLLVAWGAASMARRAPTPRFTFGLKKAPILAALFNSLVLLIGVGAIAAEAIRRLLHPAPADGLTVSTVAAIGLVVNGSTALLFARGARRDVNIRGAFLHMAADAAVSLAVVVAGLIIFWTGRQWVDPAMSLAVAFVILWSSIGLLKESVWMSLAGVPLGIEVDEVEAALVSMDGVIGIHDLHVWPLSTSETALTAHLVLPDGSIDELIASAQRLLHDRFHIGHCTLQVERSHLGDSRC